MPGDHFHGGKLDSWIKRKQVGMCLAGAQTSRWFRFGEEEVVDLQNQQKGVRCMVQGLCLQI